MKTEGKLKQSFRMSNNLQERQRCKSWIMPRAGRDAGTQEPQGLLGLCRLCRYSREHSNTMQSDQVKIYPITQKSSTCIYIPGKFSLKSIRKKHMRICTEAPCCININNSKCYQHKLTCINKTTFPLIHHFLC